VLSIVFLTVLVNYTHQISPALCPDDTSIIAPCTCKWYPSWVEHGTNLDCGGDGKIDLANITKSLSNYYELKGSDKRFHTLILHNSAITELKENDFSDLGFNIICKCKIPNIFK
jgi:hypothetical protein